MLADVLNNVIKRAETKSGDEKCPSRPQSNLLIREYVDSFPSIAEEHAVLWSASILCLVLYIGI
jgi:hypothetical protein